MNLFTWWPTLSLSFFSTGDDVFCRQLIERSKRKEQMWQNFVSDSVFETFLTILFENLIKPSFYSAFYIWLILTSTTHPSRQIRFFEIFHNFRLANSWIPGWHTQLGSCDLASDFLHQARLALLMYSHAIHLFLSNPTKKKIKSNEKFNFVFSVVFEINLHVHCIWSSR